MRRLLQMEVPASFVCVHAISILLSAAARDEALPPCPTSVNYLPQGLPMHCRLPRGAPYPMFPGGMPNLTFPPLPPLFQSPSGDGSPGALPGGVPPGMALPGGLPPGMAPGLARPAQLPMPLPLPAMPAAAPGPAHKLPVIVMPFYSPDGQRKPEHGSVGHRGQKKRRIHINKKRRPKHYSDTDTDSEMETSEEEDSRDASGDSSSAGSDAGWWRGRRSGGRAAAKRARARGRRKDNKELLTPVLQYVTRDGYVIYEKKISKNQANEWVREKKVENAREYNEPPNGEAKQKEDEDEDEAGQGGRDADAEGSGRGGGVGAHVLVHRNSHRRKPKKQSKKKAEAR